ncbi:MAG: elongation factor P [Minisyncoccales bacterium]
MLSYSDLKKGVQIIIDNEPYEVLEAFPQRYAQRKLMIQTKLKNLITGNVINKTVHQGETFEEADLEKKEIKFIYRHRGKLVFADIKNPAYRFELTEEQVGLNSQFLKPNQVLTGIKFKEKFINIILPIKVQLKVIEAPPGVKGDRAQGGTKIVKLETGAEINAPLFIETGDIVEVNTETGEYIRRIE